MLAKSDRQTKKYKLTKIILASIKIDCSKSVFENVQM